MSDLYFIYGNLEVLLDLSPRVVHILQERTRYDICLLSSANVALKYAALTLRIIGREELRARYPKFYQQASK